jgi:PAS domain S-box-containing protein
MKRTIRVRPAIAALGIVIVCGSWSVKLAARADAEMREDLLDQTQRLGQAINLSYVKRLAAVPADVERPEYKRLKASLCAIRGIYADCRFIYLLTRDAPSPSDSVQPAHVRFMVDSEPAESKDCSPPGQIYQEESAECRRVFDTQRALAFGPYQDRWGHWISSRVPIQDPDTGKTLVVAAFDVAADKWQTRLLAAAAPPLALLLVLLALQITGLALFARRPGLREPRPRALGAALVLAAGVAISLFFAWQSHSAESRNRSAAFRALASAKTSALVSALEKLRDVELEGLASFIRGSDAITPNEFQTYANHLTKNPVVQAWEWIPCVPATELDAFERGARAAGLAGFEVWQHGPSNTRIPARARTAYYPVLHIAPRSGNERVVGFDLGSEPLRREALDEAARTGFTTGTRPIALIQETASQKGMLLFNPVLDARGTLRGFALAVLRLGTVLDSVASDRSLSLAWSLLNDHGPSERLAASSDLPAAAGLLTKHPVLLFGKTYVLTSQSGPDFARSHPARAGKQAALAGLAITLAIAIVVYLVARRHDALERRVAERTAELQASEERHRAMFEKNHSIQLLIDPGSGDIIDANSAASEFYGYTRERLRQLTITDINTLPGDAVRASMALACSEEFSGFHFRHRLADGTLREVEVHSSPIRSNGHTCLYSIIHDITERVRAEQSLARLGEIQRHLMLVATQLVNIPLERQGEAVASALATLGRLIQADRACLADYDFARGLLTCTHTWFADDAAQPAFDIQTIPLSHAPVCVAHHRRGDPYHVASVASLPEADAQRPALARWGVQSLLSFPLISAGACLGFVFFAATAAERVWGQEETDLLQILAEMLADLKARRLAEAELRQLSAERGMLLDTMSSQVWYLKDPATYGLANRAHAAFLGLSREAIEHRRLDAFLPADTAAVCLKSNAEVFSSHKPAQTQEWAPNASGEHRLLEIYKNPCIDDDGSVAYVVCVAYDITEQQRLQEELVRARDLAEQTARAKATFLAHMSHEIRTPLNVILGYAQILNRTCTSCANAKSVAAIRASGEHLLDLINGVLLKSASDIHSLPLDASAFDLRAMLAEIRTLFTQHPDARELFLEADVASDVPAALSADKGKIRQVLLNLVANAIKFTPRGYVRIRAFAAQQRTPFARPASAGNRPPLRLAVEVSDSGCGIPAGQLDAVFEAYVTTDAPASKRAGTGIGLPLSRRFARALGGDLTVTSAEGAGSVFLFTFDAALADAPQAVDSGTMLPRVLQRGGPPPNILVVDDDPAGRQMQVDMLITAGFSASACESGESALARLAAGERFCLILLDKRMPNGLDGLETMRRIRAALGDGAPPILLFTASAAPDDAEAVRAIGGQGVLHKPVQTSELFAAISRVSGVAYEGPSEPFRACLAQFSAADRSLLRDAVSRGNMRALKQATRNLADAEPALAAHIDSLANAYDYDALTLLLGSDGAVGQPQPPLED